MPLCVYKMLTCLSLTLVKFKHGVPRTSGSGLEGLFPGVPPNPGKEGARQRYPAAASYGNQGTNPAPLPLPP